MSIQIKRGTSSKRAASSDTLKAGQPFFETDTGKLYIGTGTTYKDAVSTLPALSQSNTFSMGNTFNSTVDIKNSSYLTLWASTSNTGIAINNSGITFCNNVNNKYSAATMLMANTPSKYAVIQIPNESGTLALSGVYLHTISVHYRTSSNSVVSELDAVFQIIDNNSSTLTLHQIVNYLVEHGHVNKYDDDSWVDASAQNLHPATGNYKSPNSNVNGSVIGILAHKSDLVNWDSFAIMTASTTHLPTSGLICNSITNWNSSSFTGTRTMQSVIKLI